jgi:hypothetical protein
MSMRMHSTARAREVKADYRGRITLNSINLSNEYAWYFKKERQRDIERGFYSRLPSLTSSMASLPIHLDSSSRRRTFALLQ